MKIVRSEKRPLTTLWTHRWRDRGLLGATTLMLIILAVPVHAQTDYVIQFSTPTTAMVQLQEEEMTEICVTVKERSTSIRFPLSEDDELEVRIINVTDDDEDIPTAERATQEDYEISDRDETTDNDDILTFSKTGEQCRDLEAVEDDTLEGDNREQLVLGLEIVEPGEPGEPDFALDAMIIPPLGRTFEIMDITDATDISWQQRVSRLSVPEGEGFFYLLDPNVGLATQDQTVSIRITVIQSNPNSAELTDFVSGIVAFSENIDIFRAEALSSRSVRVTFIGPLSSSRFLGLILQIMDDDRLERVEALTFRLDEPRVNGVAGGNVSNSELSVFITQDSTPSLQEFTKLATPLVLRAALPSLSDAVRTHVTHVLQDTSPPAPQATPQGFHVELAGFLGVHRTPDQHPQVNWNVWTSGRHTAVDSITKGSARGNVFNLWAGFDYRVLPQLLIGGLFGYERSDLYLDELEGNMSGDGFAAGSYIGVRLMEGVIADFAIVGMNIGYDIQALDLSRLTTTGPFKVSGFFSGNRLMVLGAITGTWYVDTWRLTPRLSVGWTREWHEKYQDTLNTRIAAQVFSFGYVSIGPEVARYVEVSDDLWLEPFLGLEREFNFDAESPQATLPSLSDNEVTYAVNPHERAGYRVRGGLAGQWHQLSFRAQGSYDAPGLLRKGFTAWSSELEMSYGWNDHQLLSLQSHYAHPNSLITTATYSWRPDVRLVIENQYDGVSEHPIPISLSARIEWTF